MDQAHAAFIYALIIVADMYKDVASVIFSRQQETLLVGILTCQRCCGIVIVERLVIKKEIFIVNSEVGKTAYCRPAGTGCAARPVDANRFKRIINGALCRFPAVNHILVYPQAMKHPGIYRIFLESTAFKASFDLQQ